MQRTISFGWRASLLAGVLCAMHTVQAQAPAGATGQCNDGSYSTAAKKTGACRGHQGVKSWFADSSKGTTTPTTAAPASPAATTSNAAPSPQTAPAPASPATGTATAGKRMSPEQRAAATPQAPGGGGGKVWVNTESKVYHCEGTTFYGKTKAGQYMTEADAKAAGARPDRNKPCSK